MIILILNFNRRLTIVWNRKILTHFILSCFFTELNVSVFGKNVEVRLFPDRDDAKRIATNSTPRIFFSQRQSQIIAPSCLFCCVWKAKLIGCLWGFSRSSNITSCIEFSSNKFSSFLATKRKIVVKILWMMRWYECVTFIENDMVDKWPLFYPKRYAMFWNVCKNVTFFFYLFNFFFAPYGLNFFA